MRNGTLEHDDFSHLHMGGDISILFDKQETEMDKDPNGKDQHEAGAKLDQGKVKMSLITQGFPRALAEVGKVGTFGAEKYSRHGWREVPDGENRYTDAMMRHLLQEDETYLDHETGLPHAAAVAWNALARLQLILERMDGEEVCKRVKSTDRKDTNHV